MIDITVNTLIVFARNFISDALAMGARSVISAGGLPTKNDRPA